MANYQSFEVKEGGVLERVATICRHLTTKGIFLDTSPIPVADVERFIDDAYYWLLSQLNRNGYSKTQANTDVKGALQTLQAIAAAVKVEFSVPTTATGEENTRYRGLVRERDDLVSLLLETDALEQLGATKDRAKSKYLQGTGRSIDRKRDIYIDSDIVPSRFPRGFGRRRDVPDRSGTDTASGADPSQVQK